MTLSRPYHPGDPVDWAAVRADLRGLDLDDSPDALQRAAADYHWYSPVLKRRLAGREP
jgi:hypothetical protein